MKKTVHSLFVLLGFLPVSCVLAGGETGEYNLQSAKGHVVKKKTGLGDRAGCNKGPFVMYPGSLKDNIERIAASHCWYVVKWKADSDFEWAGSQHGTVIRASTLQDALRKVLHKYPLQAQFYMGNRVLAIEPRTLKNEL